MKPTLNLGCGDDTQGDVRVDYYPYSQVPNLIGDAHNLPLRKKSIGITLCKSVLEHVESPINVIREMKRVTENEIIIVVPNLLNIRRILRTLQNPLHEMSSKARHLQGWDVKAMRHLARLAGLDVKSIRWQNTSPQRWWYLFMPLFASHMVAILVRR